MSYLEKPEIIVPTDWNAEKDYQDYVATFGDSGEPVYQEAIWRLRASANELADVIAFAIKSLTRREDGENAFRSMSLVSQLDLLQTLVDSKTSGQAHERIVADLKRCHEVIALRDKIVSRHVLKPEFVWLYELGGTSDWIVTAWSILLESLQAELGFPMNWRPSSDTWLDWYE